MITEYKAKVDSCRISIPVRLCTIKDQTLQDNFIDHRTNTTTGEVEEIKKYKGKPFAQPFEDGTYVKIWIGTQITYVTDPKSQFNEPYITILLNSKHLKLDYFDGITENTFRKIYDYITSLNIFECEYQSFLNARYSDVDIAFDFYCSKPSFKILKDLIKKITLLPHLWFRTDQDDNSGIWTPTKYDPRKQAIPSKPYVKFYSKQIDFETKSKIFAQTYFPNGGYADIVRFECTLKNSNHKKLLKLTDLKTFGQFLSADLNEIASLIFSRYFKKTTFVKNVELKTSNMDEIFIDLINFAITRGDASMSEIQNMFYNRADFDRKTKSKYKAKFEELVNSEKIHIDHAKGNEISSEVFRTLGVDLSRNLDSE